MAKSTSLLCFVLQEDANKNGETGETNLVGGRAGRRSTRAVSKPNPPPEENLTPVPNGRGAKRKPEVKPAAKGGGGKPQRKVIALPIQLALCEALWL